MRSAVSSGYRRLSPVLAFPTILLLLLAALAVSPRPVEAGGSATVENEPQEIPGDPCVAPTPPGDCVQILGPIGTTPVVSPDEGFLHIASPVVRPMARLDTDGPLSDRLYAVNPLGNSVRVFETGPGGALSPLNDIPVCYRPSAIVGTSGGAELLVSCHASHAVAVVDPASQRVVGLIQDRDDAGRPRLQEPMAIVVRGNLAYVASSQNSSVVVIDVPSRRVLRQIDLPGQDPRTLAITPNGKYLLAANLLAGNRSEPAMNFNAGVLDPNTAAGAVCEPLLQDPTALAVALEGDPAFMDTSHPEFPTIAECYFFAHTFGTTTTIVTNPDRTDHDVVGVDLLADDAIITSNTLPVDVGTLNYDLALSPDGARIYVASTHANNALNTTFGDRPLVNQLAIIDFDQTNGTSTVNAVHDLDANWLDPATGAGTSQAAIPYALEVDGSRVLLTAAASNALLVTDANGALQNTIAVGHTPKGVLSDGGNVAWVYEAGAQTISTVDLSAGSITGTVSIGDNALPQRERIGMRLFSSAHFSSNGTFACASCHPEGHLDGLVWQLNDVDGLRSTMTVQEISETAPYHWDGSKCNQVQILEDGITGLFGNPAGPTACEIETMIAFMDNLVRPHSPHRAADDSMSEEARLGAAVLHRANFKDLDDNPTVCTGRVQDPAVERTYLNAIGDPGKLLFNFNGGGGPVPNTLVAESCSVANCHVSPHTESDGFVNGDPNQGLIDGFQAVSTLGTWDRPVTMHDARTTRAKFVEALDTNREFHGARGIVPTDVIDGKVATHGFNDTHFRHVEYNFDGSAETHGFVLSDGLTQFMMEEEELQASAVGLSILLDRPSSGAITTNRELARLQDAANDGKITLLGVGVLGGAMTSLTWQPGANSYLATGGTTYTTQELKDALLVGDALMFYGGLLPGQDTHARPKLRSLGRGPDVPVLCAEGPAEYQAAVQVNETGAQLEITGIDVAAGSRVLIDGSPVGTPLAGPGPAFTWTLPTAPDAPRVLAVQLMSPAGLLSNSLPLPVLDAVVPAFEPIDVAGTKSVPGDPNATFDWTDQFGITGPGTRFDVFRGTIADLRSDLGFSNGICFAPGQLPALALDVEVPEQNDGFFYVMRAQNQTGVTPWGSVARNDAINASGGACSPLFP